VRLRKTGSQREKSALILIARRYQEMVNSMISKDISASLVIGTFSYIT